MTENVGNIRREFDNILSEIGEVYPEGEEKDRERVETVASRILALQKLVERWIVKNNECLLDAQLSPIVQRLMETRMWLNTDNYLQKLDSEYQPAVQKFVEARLWFHMLSALQAGL